MRLRTMAILVALLMSATSSAADEGVDGVSELKERPHRRRHHRVSNLRLSGSRQRQRHLQRRRADEPLSPEQLLLEQPTTPYVLPADEPLQLAAGFGEPPLLSERADQLEAELGRREARHRWQPADGDVTVCCPTVEERTRPLAGTRRDGTLALLDTSDGLQQVFYEISCRNHTAAEQQRFAQHLRKRQTVRCVQEYSYSQALYYVEGRRVLDYIRVRSGCRCELMPAQKPRRSACHPHHRRKRKRERVRSRRQRLRCQRERRRDKARRQSHGDAAT